METSKWYHSMGLDNIAAWVPRNAGADVLLAEGCSDGCRLVVKQCCRETTPLCFLAKCQTHAQMGTG